MSKMEEYEEKYKWVRDALLEEFPDGEVVFQTEDYGHRLYVGIYTKLPNGVAWRKGIVCVKDGCDNLEEITPEAIKRSFRKSYQRACYEQQTSGS